jgi:hypothetical protein
VARKSKPSRRHHGAQAKVVDICAALKKSFETAERPAAESRRSSEAKKEGVTQAAGFSAQA